MRCKRFFRFISAPVSLTCLFLCADNCKLIGKRNDNSIITNLFTHDKQIIRSEVAGNSYCTSNLFNVLSFSFAILFMFIRQT